MRVAWKRSKKEGEQVRGAVQGHSAGAGCRGRGQGQGWRAWKGSRYESTRSCIVMFALKVVRSKVSPATVEWSIELAT